MVGFVQIVGLGIIPVVGGHVELEKLTRRHAVRISPHVGCSLEEASYAVGEVVGFESVKSASCMNSAVVRFLDDVAKVETRGVNLSLIS